MNLGNEVIVKNFHVLKSGHKLTAVPTDNGMVYLKVQTDAGAVPTDESQRITTDQFCKAWIKHARLTKPSTPVFKKWEITVPSTLPDPGTLLTVYMHFTNLYGYGITDRWEKFATVVVKSGETAANVATKLAAQINNQYINGMRPISASASSNKVTLVDNTYTMQTPTRRRMEMHMDPQPIQMTITTNILEGDDVSWATEVSTANASNESYAGIVDADKSYKNDYLIWGLEKVSQLNSTEHMADPCTGFIGYDSVMDNAQLNTANYYVLDIAYETLPKMGVPSGRNLKEVSFAALPDDAATAFNSTMLTALGISGLVFPVATPTFTRGSSHSVTLACSTSSAVIKYTVDNGANWSPYSQAVTLSSGQTLKAYATKTGMADSEMIEVPYV